MARAKKRSGWKRYAKTAAKLSSTAEDNKQARPIERADPKSVSAVDQGPETRSTIMSAPRLFGRSCAVLKNHWKMFTLMGVAYVAAYVLLVGISNGTLTTAKADLALRHANGLPAGASLVTTLLNSSGNNTNTAAGVYQTIMLLIMSLALIWALRQLADGQTIRARDAFYKGSAPLIPFLLVLLVVGLELLPMVAGGALYNMIVSNGVAVGGVEKVLAMLLCLALAAVSLYLICSSLFALYIITEPDATPMRALRRARGLVRRRRLLVWRKLLFMPVAVGAICVVILLPVALYLTALATFVFLLLTTVALAVVHSYMYSLYRELQ